MIGYGQKKVLYCPVTINSPLFKKNQEKEFQIGLKINNYGRYIGIARQFNKKIIVFSIQQNDGNYNFDPLRFNDYEDPNEEKHLIQSNPTQMFYSELGLGYDFNIEKQKISLIYGIGKEWHHSNSRYFMQVDWGNESKLINAGISLRGNYTTVENTDLITLEPTVQGKIKIYNLRIVNQFGYSIALKKKHDYMKPILTVGLEFILDK